MKEISIIIPNLNNKERLFACLYAVFAQIREDVEVILVDNGSTDGAKQVVNHFDVKFIEVRHPKSPYVCKNEGLKIATGNYIIFLDSNCIPHPDWLKAGLQLLTENQADLVIGPLVYEYSNPPSKHERFDFLYSIVREEDMMHKTSLPGGNLFVRKEVIEKIGEFPEVRSKGDIIWTNKAYHAGFRLGYAKDAKVDYPAKGKEALSKKAIRLGNGAYFQWQLARKSFDWKWYIYWLKNYLPPSPKFLMMLMQLNQRERTQLNTFQLFWLAWEFKIGLAKGMKQAMIHHAQ
ncbi:MAG: glycosyltransferase family A protein [Bacteroidota bacterium]